MRTSTIRKWISLVAGVGWVLGAASAQAVPILIDFSTGLAGAGGTISISGGDARGSGILIDAMTVLGTTADGAYDVDGQGVDNFEPNDSTGLLSFDTALNTISIVGGIPALGIPEQTTLLTGAVSSFTLFSDGVQLAGLDSKEAALLIALGIEPTTVFQHFGFSIGFAASSSNPGELVANSTDVKNTPVPEPATMTLVGAGLLGLAGMSVRRKKA